MNRKNLWDISKVIYEEVFFQTQLNSAGSQKSRVLERYESNIGGLRRTAFLNMIISSLFMLSISTLPLIGLIEVLETTVTSENVLRLLLANSLNMASYYVITMVLIFVFGIMTLMEFFKGEMLQNLTPLPLKNEEIQQIGVYTFFRMHYLQILVLIFSFPIISYIFGENIILSFVILVTNIVTYTLGFYSIIVVSKVLSKRLFNSSKTSKISTILRVIFIITYMLIIFNLYTVFGAIAQIIQEIYSIQGISGSFGLILNVLLSLIFFPITSGYIISIFAFPRGDIPLILQLSSFFGFLMLITITLYVMRKGNRILRNLGAEEEFSQKVMTKLSKVSIKIDSPTVALIKNSLLMASRSYAGLVSLVFPVLFVLLGTFGRSGTLYSNFDPFILSLFYVGITPMILKNGLFTAEETMGGLLSSLPVKHRNHFRSKQVLMIIFASIPVPVILLIQFISKEPFYLMSAIGILVLNLLVPTIYLILHAILFGKLNRSYSLYTVNLENKTIKNIILLIIPNLLVFILIFVYLLLSIQYNEIVSMLIIGLIGFIILEIIMRKIFK